jgi:hypothetical protein
VQGPGGGTIVYVDSTNEMPGYDYLEVAPENAIGTEVDGSGVVWSTATTKCGVDAATSCREFLIDASYTVGQKALGAGRTTTAAIVARHNAGAVAKTDYAAGIADAYTTATASDWFLPSLDEWNEACKYGRNTGQAPGASIVCQGGEFRTGWTDVWTSTEYINGSGAWYQLLGIGQTVSGKEGLVAVRAMRAF